MPYYFDETRQARLNAAPSSCTKSFRAPRKDETHLYRFVRWMCWLEDSKISPFARRHFDTDGTNFFRLVTGASPRFLSKLRDVARSFFGGELVSYEELEQLSTRPVLTIDDNDAWIALALKIQQRIFGRAAQEEAK